MNASDVAVTLRRRSPWEACDLGLAMLQRWWRPVYGAHLAVGASLAAALLAVVWLFKGSPWIVIIAVWWLKPLYDRVVLHVLSRAVFGEIQAPRMVLARAREWLATGLAMALTFARFDLARSFNLPVRQLEGLHGTAGGRRREVLGRRTRSHAVWLTVVCVHLELIVLLSLDSLLDLFVPAKAAEGLSLRELFFPGGTGTSAVELRDAAVYAAGVLLFEPFYVAAGFGLYLNRRILLEGWDLEVALRTIGERRSVLAAAAMCLLVFVFFPPPSAAQEPKDPKVEMAEVLKDPQFGRWEETTMWKQRNPAAERKSDDGKWLAQFGRLFGKAFQILIWIAAIVLVAWLIWRLYRALPASQPRATGEPYRPPAALFGMALAPETLPADVAATAEALAREGRLREALSLLYRGSLSELVHKRNVELLPSHTESEAVRLARPVLGGAAGYLETLVNAWAACAYARRLPKADDVARLAVEYRGAFA